MKHRLLVSALVLLSIESEYHSGDVNEHVMVTRDELNLLTRGHDHVATTAATADGLTRDHMNLLASLRTRDRHGGDVGGDTVLSRVAGEILENLNDLEEWYKSGHPEVGVVWAAGRDSGTGGFITF